MRKGIRKIFRIHKEEVIKIISKSESISDVLKYFDCNRKQFVRYLEIYQIRVPFDWLIDKKSLKIYVKRAMRECRYYTTENIMMALYDIMPNSVQEEITYNKIDSVLKEILQPKKSK